MKAERMQYLINSYMQEYSGLDQHRDYLGISKVALCPKQAILEYRNGVGQPSEFAHRMCYAGYEQEAEIMKIMLGANISKELKSNEVVAPFDSRLRGHVDGETVDGELLEIKSVSTHKYQAVSGRNWALRNHFIQVQLYMRYGPWKNCFIVYRCRETYEHHVVHVQYSERQAFQFENKAKLLLAHIDADTIPACDCGRHN